MEGEAFRNVLERGSVDAHGGVDCNRLPVGYAGEGRRVVGMPQRRQFAREDVRLAPFMYADSCSRRRSIGDVSGFIASW